MSRAVSGILSPIVRYWTDETEHITTVVVLSNTFYGGVLLPSKKRAGRKRTKEAFSQEAERLGEAIRKARLKRGWTLTSLAAQLDITQQGLSKIEAGQVNPDNPQARWTLSKLAEKLESNFGLSWLKTGSLIYLEAEERRAIEVLAKDQSHSFAEQARLLIVEALRSHARRSGARKSAA